MDTSKPKSDRPKVLNVDLLDSTLDFVGLGQRQRLNMPTPEELKRQQQPISTLEMDLDSRGVSIRYTSPAHGKRSFLVPMSFIKRMELEP